jgi:AmiR/NasT family two-component response regulator
VSDRHAPRVLIAEDEALIRLDLKEMLREAGYEVVDDVATGEDAVERARELKPDLVVLDIKMPGMGGLAAAEQIAAERLSAVLLLTAFSQREMVERAAEVGAMGYLVKPFNESDIVPAVEVALARARQLQALETEVDDLTERLETRKLLDRAKGVLMDTFGYQETGAYRFLQTQAMERRLTMKRVAESILDGSVVPPGPDKPEA